MVITFKNSPKSTLALWTLAITDTPIIRTVIKSHAQKKLQMSD